MQRIAFKNARLIDGSQKLDVLGGLLIEDGNIIDIGPRLFADGIASVDKVIDCNGLCLAPGIIDLRVKTNRSDISSLQALSRCAAAGGVTTIGLTPNDKVPLDTVEKVEHIARINPPEGAEIMPFGAMTVGSETEMMTEIGALKNAGVIGLSNGNRVTKSANILRRFFSYAKMFDICINLFPLHPELAEGNVAHASLLSETMGLPAMSSEVEVLQLSRDILLAESVDVPIHFSPVTTAKGVAYLRRAMFKNNNITASTSPNYFMLNDLAIKDYQTFAKFEPALGSEEDRKAIAEAISEGIISSVVSDHTPHGEDDKRQPFYSAASGAVGLETLLPLALAWAREAKEPIHKAIELITYAPSKLAGLDRGVLLPNYPADLVLFDPDYAWILTKDSLTSSTKNTPFLKMPMMGKAVQTWVNGRLVFEDKKSS